MRRHLDEADEKIILFEAGKSTPKEIASMLGIKLDDVYAFGRKKGLSFKMPKPVRNYVHAPVKVKEKAVPLERPPAAYSNSPSPFGIWDEIRNQR